MEDLDLARRLVVDAAELAATMRSTGLDVDHKTSISDVVTDADRAAERLVVETLRRERPDDAILGEEGTNVPGTSGRRWIIDPVDGTYNFASGLYHWCSALALVHDDDVVFGAVAHHDSGRVWLGGPGLPTTVNGRRIPSIVDRPVEQISSATYLHPGFADDPTVLDPWLRAARLPATTRMLGSGSMEMVAVAEGELGVWFQHGTLPWDWFPGAALIRGAGGAATSQRVGEREWFVSGPSTAVQQVLSALADGDE